LSLRVVAAVVAIPAQVGLVDYFRKQQEVLRQQRRTQSRLVLVVREHQQRQIKAQAGLILYLILLQH
jgi:hypothetical protein